MSGLFFGSYLPVGPSESAGSGTDRTASRPILFFSVDEAGAPKKPAGRETRRLMAPRDDLRPTYLNTQGLRVGKSGHVLLRNHIEPH
jgi:hypothetical protein